MLIRPALPSETGEIGHLAMTAGMFTADELPALIDILTRFHEGTHGLGHTLAVAVNDDGIKANASDLLGVIYFGPDPMTDRKWDLWMIAVSPTQQRAGLGSALLTFAEQQAREQQGRIMLIDTSSQPKFDPARNFYRRNGYTQVAQIPDFYTENDDKIVFQKKL